MNALGGAAVRPEVYNNSPRFARKRAQAAGEVRYFSGRTCPAGHVAERYTQSGACVQCALLVNNSWHKAHPGEHRRAHPTQYAVYKSRRRAAEKAPSWATEICIAAVYGIAERLRKSTGIKFTVDHVVPLQGRRVSGLHVRDNLQILTSSDNSRKFNTFVVA